MNSPLVFTFLLSMPVSMLLAQTPPAPNLVINGGFEQFSAQDNLWDGVDSEGNIAGRVVGLKALAESGGFRSITMPISVAAGDLNGDGLIDIMTADPYGYYQVFFNSGSKTEPKFTNAENFPLFLSATPGDDQKAPRIDLTDWSRRGMLDLTVGNYNGEIYFLPNSGSPTVPEFRQPANLAKATTPTTKKGELWANLLAPAAFDFNKDGKTDLAVGEGSYSANAVHLLINQGTNNQPRFDETNRFYLAYGDGREHLTPTIIDYNGDGQMDVIASNREGKVGIYLNPGPLWKPGTDFKHSGDIQFGSSDNLGGFVTIHAVDLNGDGLVDLLIGKSNGRIALSTNSGTKTEPKFSVPVDLKGTDIWGRNLRNPAGWTYDVGLERGNFSAAATVVGENDDPKLAPPEGKSALKIGYFPSQNKLLKTPEMIAPGNPNQQNLWFNTLQFTAAKLPSDVFLLERGFNGLNVGRSYTLKFKSKGNNATALKWTFSWRGYKKLAEDKVEAGERGSASVTKFEIFENGYVNGTYNATPNWSESSKSFNIDKFKNKDMADVLKADGVLEIRGTLVPNLGAVYLDDFELVEKN